MTVIILIILVQLFLIKKPIDSLLVSIILFYRALISTLGVQGSWQKTQEYVGSLEVVLDKLNSLSKNIEKNGTQKIIKFQKDINIQECLFQI